MAGLAIPSNLPAQPDAGASPSLTLSMGGVVVVNNKRLTDQQKAAVQARQDEPEIQGLVHYVQECWYKARDHKRMTIEPVLFKCLRQRQGEYDPEKLEAIKKQGGSEVYMTLTGNKCRAASSWLKDVLLNANGDRTWNFESTPIPDLPDDIAQQVKAQAVAAYQQALQSGYQMQGPEAYAMAQSMKTSALHAMREDAQMRADRMADKVYDQLVEGGFREAFADFIDDLVTFPAAILKGPVVRRRKKLKWEAAKDGQYKPVVQDKLVPEYERVSPFDIYPSPDSYGPEDGYLIERHRLTRQSLLALKGVEGYDDDAIDLVLDQYYANGWQEWLFSDAERADVEGRSPPFLRGNPDGKIDALQFWGAVNGRRLIDDWGMSEKEVPEPTEDYEVELWLINRTVIKCVLNPDPLKRRMYYVTSYQPNPGGFYGTSLPELIADIQAVCNATARALVNNMGLASGPQVGINVSRLAPGEDVTQLFPWRIWQFTDDPMGSNRSPIEFFQPQTMVQELMAVYDKFEQKADDYTGIPKYMVGGEATNGIGRTASGLSAMMQNAGKTIKQVISNVDIDVLCKALQRQYDWNMQFADDPDLKGDVSIIVNGANSAMVKDALHMRRNEFLQITNNPNDMQIVGAEGRATLLREVAKDLDVNVDRVVPDREMLKIRAAGINASFAAQANPNAGQPQTPPPPVPGQQAQPAAQPLRAPGAPAGAVMTPARQGA
jgi:hypothetical protein